ncbi:hypothetical protein G7046_g4057 [Stylonectria norvegica]|nr:hypothetical protein G7046_g4057 [Stylonectria norvegica]
MGSRVARLRRTVVPSAMALAVPEFLPSWIVPCKVYLDFKFQDLMWAERDRVLDGARNEAVEDFKWGTFKQVDMEERGVMDRYINIKPWNHNRIKLNVPENELNYVNASPITLASPSDPDKPPLQYIAMQGPTEPSLSYLTTMSEGGVVKCHQYFPDDDEHSTWVLNEHNVWGDDWQAQLTYDDFEELADGAIEKRKLLLHIEGEEEPRVVWHLLYRRWPDFGVPELEDLDSFLELMKLSRDHSAPSNPRIIHCSAGVGRTGTFIALEHLMRELDTGALENYDVPAEGPDLVYETVDTLREQRVGMVQGKPQFQFIYQVMRKLWQDKYGSSEEGEPVAKRLEVGDPFLDAGPGPDANEVGIAK